jgi:DNA transformation protein and related proteins
MDAEGLKALFEPVGTVAVKRMFGGHGVYADGLCFAIQSQGEVYLKADAESEKLYADAGSAPFVYVARGSRWPHPIGASLLAPTTIPTS